MASDPISDDFDDTDASPPPRGESPSSEEALLKEQLSGIEGGDEDGEGGPKESMFPEDAGKLGDPVPWLPTPRPGLPAYFHRKLRPHQDLALESMEQAPSSSSILAMEMGLGKVRWRCILTATHTQHPPSLTSLLDGHRTGVHLQQDR